ncbi:hypothetical protein PABG_12373 [Paracoccidioides brasiliensis Pb03]|nr:hypothetical protein PABG_12373 [Paracoccidioides brasiliensis Pb03]
METRETGKLIRAHNNGLNYVTEPFSGIGVSLTHTTAAEYLKSIFDVPMQRESENLSLLSPGILHGCEWLPMAQAIEGILARPTETSAFLLLQSQVRACEHLSQMTPRAHTKGTTIPNAGRHRELLLVA